MGGIGSCSMGKSKASGFSDKRGSAARGHLNIDDFAGFDRSMMIDFIATDLGVSKEIAEDYYGSVLHWATHGYSVVRNYQQFGDAKAREKGRVHPGKSSADGIEGYIAHAPKWNGGDTYRGIGGISNETYQSLTTPGAIIGMKGTASWTSSKGVADGYTEGMNPVVFVSKTQRQGTSIKHLAKYSSENEVTVSKNASYRVKRSKKDKKNGIMYVYLEEV